MEEFKRMPFDEKVSYLIENLRKLPDDLANEGVEVRAAGRRDGIRRGFGQRQRNDR